MENNKKNFLNKNLGWLLLIGIIILIGIFSMIGYYNNFVAADQDVNAKWSEVQNQYQRQADLIPNLVSIVSSSVGSETKFVKDVIAARSAYENAQNLYDKDKTGTVMNNQLAFFVKSVAEQYPDFKANNQYITLTDEFTGTQNRITVARGKYIESIQNYNLVTKKFPGNLFAKTYGFSEKDYYKADSNSLVTPKLGNQTLP